MKFFTLVLLFVASLCYSSLQAQNISLNNSNNDQVRLYYIEDNQRPATLTLKQNYPNPVKNFTNFEFSIPEKGKVKLAIYSLLGKELSVLVDQELPAGRYRVEWDSDLSEEGMYFYILEAGGQSQTKSFKIIR